MREASADEVTMESVHLIASYPVRWSRFQVLRDFMQNFFDAVGPAGFSERVRMDAKDEQLEFATTDRGFELTWLTHIGASTKTQAAAGTHAGYFGEGFKIAALCAVRDFRWTVHTGSQNWSAEVVLARERIGRSSVQVLSYRVTRSNPRPGETWLRLGRLSSEDQALAQEVRLCFFFPGNSVVGQELCASECVVVARTSERQLGSTVPFAQRKQEPGLLFLAHQARATLPFPLIIALPRTRTEERDRPSLYDFQVIDHLASAAQGMSPEVALELLGYLRAHWRLPLPRGFKVGSWARVVAQLIRRIESSPPTTSMFHARHPHLYVTSAVPRGDNVARNRRSTAMAWMRTHVPRYTLVQQEFARLGCPTVEAACEAGDGYPRAAAWSEVHEARAAALAAFVDTVLGPLLAQVDTPRVEVLDLRGCGWRGIATVTPHGGVRYSATGRRLRNNVLRISLSAEALDAPSPAGALATYIHERCHAFGGDRAQGFSAALTDAIELMAQQGAALASLQAAWTKAGECAPPNRLASRTLTSTSSASDR